jgi:hypothetical protein
MVARPRRGRLRVRQLLPRPGDPGRCGGVRVVRRAGRCERCPAPGAPVRPRRARSGTRRAGRARHRRRADHPARQLVHAELQRGLHAGARAERRDPAPRRGRADAVHRRRRHRRCGRGGTDRRPAHRAALRVDRPALADLRRSGAGDRRGGGTRDPLLGCLARAARGRSSRARCAGRGNRPADLPIQRGPRRPQCRPDGRGQAGPGPGAARLRRLRARRCRQRRLERTDGQRAHDYPEWVR